jgi:hypothetical protein
MAVGQLKNRPRPRTPPGSLSMALEPKLHDGHRNIITQFRDATILVFRLPLNRPRTRTRPRCGGKKVNLIWTDPEKSDDAENLY